jgi:hypothetical protein
MGGLVCLVVMVRHYRPAAGRLSRLSASRAKGLSTTQPRPLARYLGVPKISVDFARRKFFVYCLLTFSPRREPGGG